MNAEKGVLGLLSSSAIYGISLGLSRMLSLLMVPIFTSYLAPEEYGVAGFLTSLGALLLPLLSFGITASLGVCYFNQDDETSQESIFAAAAVLLSLSAITIIPLGYLLAGTISQLMFEVADYDQEVFVVFVGFAASLAAQTWLLRSQLLDRPAIYALSNVCNVVVGLSTSWLLVAGQGYGVLGLLTGYTIGYIAQLACLIYGNRDARLTSPRLLSMMAELVKQGLPLIPGFGFLYLIQNAIRWPVQRVGGLEELGLLNFAITLGAAIGVITTAVVTAWLPYAMSYKDSWQEGRDKVQSAFTLYFAFGCLLVTLMAVGSQFIMLVMADERYLLSAKLIGLTSCFTFLISIYSLLQIPLYLNDKVKYNSIPQGVASILTAATFLLVFCDVLVGAAFSLVLGAVSLIGCQQVLVHRLAADYRLSINGLPIMRMTAVMLLVIFASMFNKPYFVFDSPFLVLATSICLFVYYYLESGITAQHLQGFYKTLKSKL